MSSARAADHGEPSTGEESGAVRRCELRCDGLALAAAERFADVAPELVPLRVVEPEDVLARGIHAARDAISRPLRPVGHLPVRADEPVPGVDLETPADVGEIEEMIRIVERPQRKIRARGAIATLP